MRKILIAILLFMQITAPVAANAAPSDVRIQKLYQNLETEKQKYLRHIGRMDDALSRDYYAKIEVEFEHTKTRLEFARSEYQMKVSQPGFILKEYTQDLASRTVALVAELERIGKEWRNSNRDNDHPYRTSGEAQQMRLIQDREAVIEKIKTLAAEITIFENMTADERPHLEVVQQKLLQAVVSA